MTRHSFLLVILLIEIAVFGCGGVVAPTRTNEHASGGDAATGDDPGKGGVSGVRGSSKGPVVAEGTVGLTIQNSPTAAAQYSCGTAHALLWGVEAPTATSTGVSWVNGSNGITVQCQVIAAGGYVLTGYINGNESTFKLSGTVSADGTGRAGLNIFDRYQALAMSDADCTLDVDPTILREGGAIWGRLSCSHLTSADDTYLWCAAEGVVAFEGCATAS